MCFCSLLDRIMHIENKSAWVPCFVFLRCFSMHYNSFCYMLELVCKWVVCMGERLDLMSDLMDWLVQVCLSENSEWEWTEIKAVMLRGIMRSQGVLRHLTYFSHAQLQKLCQRNASERFTVIQGYFYLGHYRSLCQTVDCPHILSLMWWCLILSVNGKAIKITNDFWVQQIHFWFILWY